MNIGDIITGPFFPETLEIKKVEQFGDDYHLVEGIGRQSNEYYERLLSAEDVGKITILSTASENHFLLTGQDVQQRLIQLALEIEDRHSKARALGSKQVMPLPHQIEAVYSRMLQSPSIRYLLADDPGAGKTIMSGMLIKELKARESIQRILVLVPPLVLRQWQEEMEQKFQESFKIINRAVLNEYGSQNPFVENNCCLASVYWASREEIKQLLLEAPFDLVIVDEAHKMAAYSYGKTQKIAKTKLYQLGEKLLAKTEHCLLLTATPHKGDAENFRLLMKLLEPDLFHQIPSGESLKDKSNPYIIRRLKESMVNFDGTPIFPKRTTKTIQYELTEPELELYEAVTNYVQTHFNRAMNAGHNSTAFAMMLLQRRLSSSIEAIHKSLYRRHKRLVSLFEKTEAERKKYVLQVEKYYQNSLQEEVVEQEDLLERKLELAMNDIDIEALNEEIAELRRLLSMTKSLKQHGLERKFLELEEMLFGVDGLIYSGEKILIFTESVDTLNALEQKLAERVPTIAKIVGKYSMDERRNQVELFRNSAQIMLATDAGGESINLQFCNQMINYDIPWNPNRLEQRMGRIHRIGQKNEVFIFNLVAQNTREGYVMLRLLDKLETMKEDLGNDLVYNFMGELLDGEIDLAELMKEAILSRETLDQVIAQMDKTLSDEHKELLETMRKMKFEEEAINVEAMKKEQYDIELNSIPKRLYASLINYVLKKNNVKVIDSQENKVHRIERFPKLLRDQYSKKLKLDETYRYTGYSEYQTEEVEYVSKETPIYAITKTLLNKTTDQISLKRYLFMYEVPEKLKIDLYRVVLKDGTGKELQNQLVSIAKREDDNIIPLNPYWVALGEFSEEITELSLTEEKVLQHEILNVALAEKSKLEKTRTAQLTRMHDFFVQSFETQYHETYEKLIHYQIDNVDNKNTALINQMNAQLIDIEDQKNRRLELLNKQRTITLLPPKKLAQFELIPNGLSYRVLAQDYVELVTKYEKDNGRKVIKMFDNLGVVDFYSERFNGEERFIILTKNENFLASEPHLEDLHSILDKVYIYIINHDSIEEVKFSL